MRKTVALLVWLLAAFGPPLPAQAQDDAPARVARLLETRGAVSLAPADGDSWDEAEPNRPVVYGDRLETGPGGRAALETDLGLVFLDADSALVWEGDDARTALTLDYGAVRMDLQAGGEDVALRTPDLTFAPEEPGSYRLDVDPQRGETVITVYAGAGTVYGRDGARRTLTAAQAYRFAGDDLDYTGLPLRGRDDFDAWAGDLAGRFAPYADDALPPGLVGARQLHGYGDWDDSPDYGRVWYPRVDDGWAPYRSGYWRYIAPWGWTWMDAAPWGFAPFHYGRWVYVDHHHHHHHRRRWAWVPGPRNYRACYAPALVGFGDDGGHAHHRAPVGWFPLGPRDVYRPAWRSRDDHYLRLNAPATRWLSPARLRGARHRPDGLEHYHFGRQAPAWTLADRDHFPSGRALRTRAGDERTLTGWRAAPTAQLPPPRGQRHRQRDGRPDRAGHPDRTFERDGDARSAHPRHSARTGASQPDARGAGRTRRDPTERSATATGAPAGSAALPAPAERQAPRPSPAGQRYGRDDGLRTDAVPRTTVSGPTRPDGRAGRDDPTARPPMPARWQPSGGQTQDRRRDAAPAPPDRQSGSVWQPHRGPREAQAPATQPRPAPATRDRSDRNRSRPESARPQRGADRTWSSPSPPSGSLRVPTRERFDGPGARSAPGREGGWSPPSRDDRSRFGGQRSGSGHDGSRNAGRPDRSGRADTGSDGRRDDGRALFAPRGGGGGGGRDRSGQQR